MVRKSIRVLQSICYLFGWALRGPVDTWIWDIHGLAWLEPSRARKLYNYIFWRTCLACSEEEERKEREKKLKASEFFVAYEAERRRVYNPQPRVRGEPG